MFEHILSSSLIILAVIIIRAIFRNRIPNRMIYALWVIVFIRLIIPGTLFDVKIPVDMFYTEKEYFEYSIAVDNETNAITPDKDSEDASVHINVPTDATPLPDNPDAPVIGGIIESEKNDIDVKSLTTIIYLVGFTVVLFWFGVSEFSIHRRLKRSRRFLKCYSGIKVYISDSALSPCAFGIIPSIYITTDIADSDGTELVLMHEYSHIKQLDCIRSLLRRIVTAFFWFNPLVWTYMILASRDSELSCDETVISKLNDRQRLHYAKMLLDYAPRAKTSVAGFGGKPMKKRILAITGKNKIRTISVVLAIILSLSACILGFTGCVEGSAENNSKTNESSSSSENQNSESSDSNEISNQDASPDNRYNYSENKSPTVIFNSNTSDRMPILPTLKERANEEYVRSCKGGMEYTYDELISMTPEEIEHMMLGPTSRYGFFKDYPLVNRTFKVAFANNGEEDNSANKPIYMVHEEVLFPTYESFVSEIRKYFSKDIAAELFGTGIFFEYGETFFYIDDIRATADNCVSTEYEIVSHNEKEIIYRGTKKCLKNDEDYAIYSKNNDTVFPDRSYETKYAKYVLSLEDGEWVFTYFEY